MKAHNICVVIPTYNNGGTLEGVVSDVLKYTEDVIVVNDGSTDATPFVLEHFRDKIDVVTHHVNKGKGSALRSGFRMALEKGYEYAITLDSDGQHYAEDIPAFVQAVIEHPGSVIIGARDLSNVDINGKSSFANKFSNFWFFIQTGRNLTDTQTGYRAYPLKRLHGLKFLTSRYEAELELMVFAAWNGVEIVSIPIQVYYPPQSERVSHFRPGRDFTRISILNTALCFGAIFYGAPVRFYHALKKRKLFSGEVQFFTRKKGIRMDAAWTLERLAKSAYGMSYFLFGSLCVMIPYSKLLFLTGKKSVRKREHFHKVLTRVSRKLLRRFPDATWQFRDISEEDINKPAIIICNHQSNLDLPMLMAANHKLIFLTNDWVWNNMFIGSVVRNAEYLPVSAGMESILPQLENLSNRGYSIVVFPEGTRSRDCSMQRFHQGAFRMAEALKMDILPVVLHGIGHYFPKGEYICRSGHLTLKGLERVPYTERGPEHSYLKEASRFRAMMRAEYNALAGEVETASYFRWAVKYRYVWRGWRVVAECKRWLKRLPQYASMIDEHRYKEGVVRVINSGIGVFAILYALVNKKVQVYAFEEDIMLHGIAMETPDIPSNLHLIHVLSAEDYEFNGVAFDRTYLLNDPKRLESRYDFTMYKPLKVSLK